MDSSEQALTMGSNQPKCTKPLYWVSVSFRALLARGRSPLLTGAIMKRLALLFAPFVLVGCTEPWLKVSGPDIHDSNALASVSSFIATNGWNMYTNNDHTIYWEELKPKFYISELPWKAWSGKQFQAKTRGGILYVLLGDEFHHDYYGVAYNPNTNRFDECIRGFKPIGGHWYNWAQPEFWYSCPVAGRYE